MDDPGLLSLTACGGGGGDRCVVEDCSKACVMDGGNASECSHSCGVAKGCIVG